MNLRARKAIVALAVLAAPLAVFHSTAVLTAMVNATAVPVGFIRHADIAYGQEPSQRLDVYVPKGAMRAPVAIFWHGGSWSRGSKDDVRFVGAALADAGFVAVVPNYRLYPHARFPTFVDDGARAVAWVRDSIRGYAGDADAIFLMGHSAGAHIATMIAFDDRYLAAHGELRHCIRGVVAMAGPYVLERKSDFTNAVFANASSANDARPIEHVSASAPPTLLLHGENDIVVWVSEAESLAERLRAHGVPSELRVYRGRSHRDLLAAWWWPLQSRTPVRADTMRFVHDQLR